jgi:iron complex transport system substrate-binding protein
MKAPTKKLPALVIVGVLASLFLAACGDTPTNTTVATTAVPATTVAPTTARSTTAAAATTQAATTTVVAATTQTAATTQAATGTGSALSFKDKTGETISLTKTPERIACLTGICLDILAELGVDPVLYWDSTALLPQYFGDRAKNFIKLGGTFAEPNVEDIVRSKPDLIIGLAGNHNKIRDALKSTAPLALFDPATYNESVENLRTVGQVMGRSTQAEAAIKKFQSKLALYKEKSPKTKTAVFIWSGAVGSIGIDTAQAPYGALLAEVTKYPWPSSALPNNAVRGIYSMEKLLEVDPDVIFAGAFMNVPSARKISDWGKENPLWGELKAVKNNQVYDVDVQIWITPRGTRGYSLVLDEVMTKLYPEVFPKPLD